MRLQNLIILALVLAALVTGAQAASVLFPFQGGTGTGSVPSYGNILVGTSGGIYSPSATSTLGLGAGFTGGGFTNTLAYWTNSTNLGATSSPTVGYLTATSTADTSTLLGALTVGEPLAGKDVRLWGTASGESFLWDASNNSLVVKGGAASPVFDFTHITTVTNSVPTVGTVKLIEESTGDITDGFGGEFQLRLADNAPADNQIAGIQWIRAGADNTGKLLLRVASAGTLSSLLTLDRTSGATPIQFGAEGIFNSNSRRLLFGTTGQSGIQYSGTDLIIDPKISGSGRVDLNGADIKFNGAGIGGSNPSNTILINGTLSSSAFNRLIGATLTYTGTTANISPIRFEAIHQSSSASNLFASNLFIANQNIDNANTATMRGVWGQAGINMLSTQNVRTLEAVRGSVLDNSGFTHTNSTFRSTSIFGDAAPTMTLGAGSTLTHWAGRFNGDTQVNSDFKFILEGNDTTKGDSYLSYGTASTTLRTDGVENFNLTSDTTTQAAPNFRLTATTTQIHANVGGNNAYGTTTLSVGSATVLNTSVRADSLIFISNCGASGSLGIISIGTITAGTSFVINSTSGLDSSKICYQLIQPIY